MRMEHRSYNIRKTVPEHVCYIDNITEETYLWYENRSKNVQEIDLFQVRILEWIYRHKNAKICGVLGINLSKV